MKISRSFSVIFIIVFAQLLIGQTVDELIKEGDDFYLKWDNHSALEKYLKAYGMEKENYGVNWRLSRTYSDIGEELPKKQKKEKQDYFEKAVEYGKKAVILNPDHAEGHLRLAISTGRLALFHGGKTKIRMSKEVKAQIDTVKMLDPDHFLAYYVIGRWHREISGLSFFLKAAAKIIYGGVPKASKEEALANFEKTVELNPDFVEGNVALAEMYIKSKRYEEARECLKRALEAPKTFMNDEKFKQDAAKMLDKIKNKK